MTCKDFEETVSALVDDELAQAEAEQVRSHLHGCSACSDRYSALKKAAALAATYTAPPARIDFLDRLDRRLAIELEADGFVPEQRSLRLSRRRAYGPMLRRLAAAVAIAAGAAIAYRLWANPIPPGPQASIAPPSEAARVPAPLPAEHGAPERRTPEPAPVPPTDDRPIEGSPSDRTIVDLPPRAPLPSAPEHEESAPPPTIPGSKGTIARQAPPPPAPLPKAEVERLIVRARNPRAPLEDRKVAIFEVARAGGDASRDLFEDVLLKRLPALSPLSDDAIHALGEFPRPELLPILLAVAPDRPLDVRAALERIDEADALAWLASELPRLHEDRTRLLVAESLARRRFPDAGAAIVATLDSVRDRTIGARLLLALGQAGGNAARQALRNAATDRTELFRAAAIRGLGYCAEAADQPVLIAALSKDPSPTVRSAAASALGRFNTPEALDALLDAREDRRSRRVQGAALIAMQRATRQGFFAANDWRTWRNRRGGLAGLPAPLPPTGCVLPEEDTTHPENYHGVPVISEGVVFLLDGSDSMRGDGRFERARRELIRTVRALPPGTPFAVGVFGDTVQFHAQNGLVPASPAAKEEACAWLGSRAARAPGTNVEAALRRAFALGEADQIFLLTDGAPTLGTGPAALVDEVRSITASGAVRIHAVGLFDAARPFRVDAPDVPSSPPAEFLRALARASGGVFLRND